VDTYHCIILSKNAMGTHCNVFRAFLNIPDRGMGCSKIHGLIHINEPNFD